MGLKEILPRLLQLFKRVDEAVEHALATEPDVMVLIDSPEFNHRVAKRVKAKRPKPKLFVMSRRMCGHGGAVARVK